MQAGSRFSFISAALLSLPAISSESSSSSSSDESLCVKMTSLVSSSSAFVVQGSRLEHRPCCCTEPEGESREAPVITEVVCPSPLSKLVARFFFCISSVLSKYYMFYSASLLQSPFEYLFNPKWFLSYFCHNWEYN